MSIVMTVLVCFVVLTCNIILHMVFFLNFPIIVVCLDCKSYFTTGDEAFSKPSDKENMSNNNEVTQYKNMSFCV